MDENNSQTPITPQPAQGSRFTLAVRLALIVIFVGLLAGVAYVLSINKNAQTTTPKETSQKTVQQNNKEAVAPAVAKVVCRRFTSLEEALKNPDIACQLDLSGKKLTEVPENIYKLGKLNEIDLSNNQLTSIPQKLIDMPTIISINLKNNNISSVTGIKNKKAQIPSSPKTMSTPFVDLLSLDLSGNHISEKDQQILTAIFNYTKSNSTYTVVTF